MMFKMFKLKVDAIGLSLFRVFYTLVLFCELLQLYKFRNIIYDKDPFVYTGELDISFLFYFWFVAILLLFLGLFTRFATIINYIFSVIIFSSALKFEYHVFYAYVGINFFLMFMPIARVFSLDSLLQKVKYSTRYKPFKIDIKILQINYLFLVFIGLGLVYIDSIFHKLSSKMWMDGLGVWLPSSLPMITWNDTSFLLNQEWLVKFLGYLVVVFEAVFIFLFWFKKWRTPLLLLGVFFHLGILITYPIPYFALTNIALYLLLVPVSFWKKIGSKLKFKNPIYTFYYDVECPLCNKVIIIIKHFDVFHTIKTLTVQTNYLNDNALKDFNQEILLMNIHGVNTKGKVSVGYWAYIALLKSLVYTYPLGLLGSLPGISFLGQKVYRFVAGNRLTERCTDENCSIPVYNEPLQETQDFLIKGWNQIRITQFFWKTIFVVVVLGQLLMIWFSPTIQNHFPKVAQFNKIAEVPYNQTRWFFLKYLGITHHPVFMYNNHFDGYNHIFKIEGITNEGKKILIPLLNEKGIVSDNSISGALWVNYTFRVNKRDLNLDNFQGGIVPYLKYFEESNDENFFGYVFYVKEIVTQEKWERDFLKKQIAKPWIEVGKGKFKGDEMIFEWNVEKETIFE